VSRTYVFGQTWGFSSSHRLYAAQALMKKTREDCFINAAGAISPLPTQYYLRMDSLTGGTSSLSSTYFPAWSHCVPVASGTWRKYWQSGAAYTNSGGLKVNGYIGVDLSSSVATSTARQLMLSQPDGTYEACGNTDFPSVASRVMGR